MPLFTPADRHLAKALSDLAHCNPFLPERIENERAVLGGAFDPRHADWNTQADTEGDNSNLTGLIAAADELLARTGPRLDRAGEIAADELALYEDVVMFVLYHRFRTGLDAAIGGALAKTRAARPVDAYTPLADYARPLLVRKGRTLAMWNELGHVFAGFFQIRRAFRNIFHFIIGGSRPAARLRATVWESIFTHDMRRYRRVLFDRMGDYTTLITGPSGTGKELVARAVGLSRYVPFDAAAQQFRADFAGSFFPLNLSALSPTLIESELFGHKRGSFTGAVSDRSGWLEVCPASGTVFLDEIGELDPAIQVKLLRVLQSRSFSRLGETESREFAGKIIAATNRNLAELIDTRHFREDLYYRLCSDQIEVPTLRERLTDDPAELDTLVLHLAGRLVGDEAPNLARETRAWIDEHLAADYAWPGNVRELEQCVRNVLVRKRYVPPRRPADSPHGAGDALAAAVAAGTLSADELLRRYVTLVYSQTGSFDATAKRLGIDWRTVKAKLDPEALDKASG